jgi:hypothetical protein
MQYFLLGSTGLGIGVIIGGRSISLVLQASLNANQTGNCSLYDTVAHILKWGQFK